MPLPLPPLNALRAFEAAARAGSYVAAAEELGVSAAAVSQQVRNLEEFMGKQLFMRFNNRVQLTDAGQAIYLGASEAFQSISALTQLALRGATRSRLVISALPSVANRWLEPRLAGFALAQRSLRFDLRVEDDPVDFARYDIDVRLSYGTNLYPDLASIHLIQDEVQPLCSPSYLARNIGTASGTLDGVPDDDLIHTDWGPSFGSHPTWQDWFAKAGTTRNVESGGYRVGMSGLALDLACNGVGVALGQRMMAAGDIAAGRLVAIYNVSVPLGHPYCLVYPKGKARKSGVKPLLEWLTQDG